MTVFGLKNEYEKKMEKKMAELEQRILNLEIECYRPMAEVEIQADEGNTMKKRMTLCGRIDQIYRLAQASREQRMKPKIHMVGRN
jgi:DNA mismatch repair ATPase MutS